MREGQQRKERERGGGGERKDDGREKREGLILNSWFLQKGHAARGKVGWRK